MIDETSMSYSHSCLLGSWLDLLRPNSVWSINQCCLHSLYFNEAPHLFRYQAEFSSKDNLGMWSRGMILP